MAQSSESMNEVDMLTEQAKAIIHAVHSPGAEGRRVQEATELYSQLSKHPAAQHIAVRLTTDSLSPLIQHFGFKVLLSGVRSRPCTLTSQNRKEAKSWLISLFQSERWSYRGQGVGALPPASPQYVRVKCAELIAEIARTDWPEDWPELKQALLSAGSGSLAGSAAMSLSVWCYLADMLNEDTKDLPASRRRDLTASLSTVMSMPKDCPALISCVRSALQLHGADRQVVREVLGICRSFAHVVPVQLLLQNGLDHLIQSGLEVPDLRGLAVSALGEWVEKMSPKKDVPIPQPTDLCRFTLMLAHLAATCRFNGDEQAYTFHRQVAELLGDLCNTNAVALCQAMQPADLGDVWKALLHLLRYPSLSVQLEAATGMSSLAKAHADNLPPFSSGSPPRPPLGELLGTIFVLHLKVDLFLGQTISPDRSAWLMRWIGPLSITQPPTSFEAWCQMIGQTNAFELQDAESDKGARSHAFGGLKLRLLDVIFTICQPCKIAGASEGYGALCQIVSMLVSRALVGDSNMGTGGGCWLPEFEAAVSLLEKTGPRHLREIQKHKDEQALLPSVLEPSLGFLRQVTAPAVTFNSILEYKRLDFLATWSPLYGHFGTEVVSQVLQQLITVIEKPMERDDDSHLQARALGTLVSLGKSGALNVAQLEGLNAECMRLAPNLSPIARGKLCEALAASVCASSIVDPVKKAQLVEGIISEATRAWTEGELSTTIDSVQSLASTISGAVSSTSGMQHAGHDRFQDPYLSKLRNARTLLLTFTGTVSKTSTSNVASPSTAEGADQTTSKPVQIAARVIQAWAPRIFAWNLWLLNLTTLALTAGNSGSVLSLVLRMPDGQERLGIAGSHSKQLEGQEEQVPDGIAIRRLKAVRSILWELRTATAKAVRACLACDEFWTLPDCIDWVTSIALALPHQRPHVVDLMMIEVFGPLFGYAAMTPGREMGAVPEEKRHLLCSSVLPPLVSNVKALLRACWSGSGKGAAGSLPVLPEFEHGFAQSVLSLSRTYSALLAALAGLGSPQASAIADPARGLFTETDQAAIAAPRPKKKDRNRNRYAALASIEADEHVPASSSANSGEQPKPPSGAASFVMRDQQLRDVVRSALVELLALPEKTVMERCCVGLAIWVAQLWNLGVRGGDVAAIGSGSVEGQHLQVGELLHAMSDALRILPTGLLQPVLKLVATPPVVSATVERSMIPEARGDAFDSGVPCSGGSVIDPGSVLASVVQQHWNTCIEPTMVNGKLAPSELVHKATQAVVAAFNVLTKLFKIQCQKLNIKCGVDQFYLCPALVQATQVCRGLPNTTEADVASMVNVFLDDKSAQDEKCRAVRVMLHEASPAFVAEAAGA